MAIQESFLFFFMYFKSRVFEDQTVKPKSRYRSKAVAEYEWCSSFQEAFRFTVILVPNGFKDI